MSTTSHERDDKNQSKFLVTNSTANTERCEFQSHPFSPLGCVSNGGEKVMFGELLADRGLEIESVGIGLLPAKLACLGEIPFAVGRYAAA